MVERKWVFDIEDENGDSHYLLGCYFIGTYSDAAAYAELEGDLWESRTGHEIQKMTIESGGIAE